MEATNVPQPEARLATIAVRDRGSHSCQPNYAIITELSNFSRKILSQRSVSYALNPLVIRLTANAWARWTEGHELLPAKLFETGSRRGQGPKRHRNQSVIPSR